MSEVTKAGRALGQGLMDVVGAATSPVAPVLEQLPKIAAEYAALQGNTGPLQMMQQQQQQDLMKQLVQQQMQGMKTPQQDEQLQFSLATKDYKGASKRMTELRNKEQMLSGLEKTKIAEDDKLFIKNYIESGGNINNAATLIQQAKQSIAKAPEKALITKGRELSIAAQEEQAKNREASKSGLVGKISSTIDEQIKQGLITNLDQLKASIKAELRGTETEREDLANELAVFWTKNEPRFFGLLPDKAVFSGQPRIQPQPSTTPAMSTQQGWTIKKK